MFNYGPYKCWWHIRKLYDQVTLLLALVAALSQRMNQVSSSVKIIHSDPGPDTPGGILPILAFYLECRTIWYWDPDLGQWFSYPLDFITVPTVVELRQITTIACQPQMIFTQGNLVSDPSDDQPAAYRFNPNTITADNGMSVIKPDDREDADTGRWEQVALA